MPGGQHLGLLHQNHWGFQNPPIDCQASLHPPEPTVPMRGDFHVSALTQTILKVSKLWKQLSPGFSLPSPVTAHRLD